MQVKFQEQADVLRDSIPIDSIWYILSEMIVKDIKAGEIWNVVIEYQAINNMPYNLFVSSKADTPVFDIIPHGGSNIMNHTDHYDLVCRSSGKIIDKDYDELKLRLWVKSGTTAKERKIKDVITFKQITSLQLFRFTP